jgi:predicted RNA-binding protein associated with RNAse of E/G family
MKRTLASRPDWPRVTRRSFAVTHLETPEFSGAVTLLRIDAVREPLVVGGDGDPICIADAGYTWLQHFPVGAHHTVVTMANERGAVAQWYIDICLQTGEDAQGVPWLDDLYLDVVVYPSMRLVLLDEDELLAARAAGDVTDAMVTLAYEEARRVMALVAAGQFPLLGLGEAHRRLLLARL